MSEQQCCQEFGGSGMVLFLCDSGTDQKMQNLFHEDGSTWVDFDNPNASLLKTIQLARKNIAC
jgi:hypothetical protein